MNVTYKSLIIVIVGISSFYIGKKIGQQIGEYETSPLSATCSNNFVDIETRNGKHYEFRMGKQMGIIPEKKICRRINWLMRHWILMSPRRVLKPRKNKDLCLIVPK